MVNDGPWGGLNEEDRAFTMASMGHTLEGYARAQPDFESWCQGRGLSALPASAAAIKVYLAKGITERGWEVSAVTEALYGIRHAHRTAGYGEVLEASDPLDILASVKKREREEWLEVVEAIDVLAESDLLARYHGIEPTEPSPVTDEQVERALAIIRRAYPDSTRAQPGGDDGTVGPDRAGTAIT